MCYSRLNAACIDCGKEMPDKHYSQKRCKACLTKRAYQSTIKQRAKSKIVKAKIIEDHDNVWNKYKELPQGKPGPIKEIMSSVNKIHRGCALCQGPIEAYHMLVKYSDGGLQTEKNLLPVCESCLDILCSNDNPLIACNYYLNENSSKEIFYKLISIMEVNK